MPFIDDIRLNSYNNNTLDKDILIKNIASLQIKNFQKIFLYLYFIEECKKSDLVTVYSNFSKKNSYPNEYVGRSIIQKFAKKSDGTNYENFSGKNFINYNRYNNTLSLTQSGKDYCENEFSKSIFDDDNIDEKIEIMVDNSISYSIYNKIFYGPPGTGKTYNINLIKKENYTDKMTPVADKNFVFVTFHQSYSYEDFIEGIRPVLQGEKVNADKRTQIQNPNAKEDDGDKTQTTSAKDITYTIKSGIFKKLCEKARKSKDPNERFVIFIDEINRGNISKIFGELITLIEDGYRAPVEYEWNKWNASKDKKNDEEPGRIPKPMEVTLPYSGNKFSVPENVEIYGAMNTADRSLTLIDTALRRRFEFEPMWPDADILRENLPEEGLVNGIDIPLMLERMNERIEVLYDRDHTIGHAFFLALKNVQNEEEAFAMLQDIFLKKIIPLLEEYFFEDWEKIRLVLGNQFVTVKSDEEKNKRLFPNLQEHRHSHLLHTRYKIDKEAFSDPTAYRTIYE